MHSESASLTPWDTKRPPMHSDQVFPASQRRSPSAQGAGGGGVASSAVWGDGRARESAGSTRRRNEDVNFMAMEGQGVEGVVC